MLTPPKALADIKDFLALAGGGEAALLRDLHDYLAQRSEEASALIACPLGWVLLTPFWSAPRGDSVAILRQSFHFP